MVAVIDHDRCLHISYPNAKLVPTRMFVNRSKRPLILRPRFDAKDVPAAQEKMTKLLKHKLVGKPYDYQRVLHIFIS